jgi:outer membrane protein TolC
MIGRPIMRVFPDPRRILAIAVLAGCTLAGATQRARAENLPDAWSIALSANQNLQAQQARSVSAGYTAAAARSARLPTVKTYTFEALLAGTPAFRSPFAGASSSLGGSGSSGGTSSPLASLPSTFSFLAPGQRQLPISLTYASIPFYTGGRILRTIDSANAQMSTQRSEEYRSALDLKLTVAEAYVGVLRARKNLEVVLSNVSQLASFSRDVKNRREEGLAIRSEELAAEVSLANARLSEIQARTALAQAWAT